MKKYRLLNLIFFLGFCQFIINCDRQGPDDEHLKKSLEAMGGFKQDQWIINNLNVEATENIGTEVEPVIQNRVKFTFELSDNTYMTKRHAYGSLWLEPCKSKGENFTFYAVTTSRLSGEKWSTESKLTSGIFDTLGFSRIESDQKTVIIGTEEEPSFLEKLANGRDKLIAAIKQKKSLTGIRKDKYDQTPVTITFTSYDESNRLFRGRINYTQYNIQRTFKGTIKPGFSDEYNLDFQEIKGASLYPMYYDGYSDENGEIRGAWRSPNGRGEFEFKY